MTGVRKVAQVRGPYVELPQHPDHCDSAKDLKALCRRVRAEQPGALLVADLFCGAGGLGLGLEQAGMKVVIAADHDKDALDTHRHHMGGLALDWDLGDAKVVERVAALMRENHVDVLAGGPPCQPFSKAGRSRMKFLVREGLRDAHDERRDLWQSYLEIAKLSMPRAVIMENVPDMALDREMFILRSMVLALEKLGYQVHTRILEAWRYGVPQFRQRLILVALRDGLDFSWPEEATRKVTLANAISDLPPVDGGWRPAGGAQGWADYNAPKTAFQKKMRAQVSREDQNKVFDHITRPVREDDAKAFALLDSESKYSDLPPELKRYRDDIFDDKYKRLAGDNVSRTITAHIAKDGYWYIHPEQDRTITIREAARIQTFPDHFRFSGTPSAAFRQIGNAVPPLLGKAVGSSVVTALAESQMELSRPQSETVGAALAQWFTRRKTSVTPWLRTNSVWNLLLGELALEKSSPIVVQSLWPILREFDEPKKLLDSEIELRRILAWVGREGQAETILLVADRLAGKEEPTSEAIHELVKAKLITQPQADLALLYRSEGEEPVLSTAGALRVAVRFHGDPLVSKNRNSAGRIVIGRLLGFGARARKAQLGLLELANEVCTPAAPRCGACPLVDWCKSASDFR